MADFPLAMTKAEANAFTRHLGSAKCYLEYGCGGSTLRAVQQCRGILRSIDTDASWIERLKTNPEVAEAVGRGRLVFKHVDVGPLGPWGAPATDEKLRSWPLYPILPFLKDELAYDLILVDGRFRLACLLSCAFVAQEGATILCHDYMRRHHYSVAEKYFDTLETVETLVALRKRAQINLRALYLDTMQALFEFG